MVHRCLRLLLLAATVLLMRPSSCTSTPQTVRGASGRFSINRMLQQAPGPAPPRTPYADPSKVCVPSPEVGGYPGSPFRFDSFLFTRPYRETNVLAPTATATRADGRVMDGYQLVISNFTEDIIGEVCPPNSRETKLVGYNAQSPAPTFRVPAGRETLLRITNNLFPDRLPPPLRPRPPCVGPRVGRPVITHLHGMASLSPFDGWAEGQECAGESKDHIYPNNRPATLWYHDHALDITSANTVFGLVGQYIVSALRRDGGCGAPFNLDSIPADAEHPMLLEDRVFHRSCQLLYDGEGVHQDDYYGDVMTVNGVAWPLLQEQPRLVYFRWTNVGGSRPLLLQLRNTAAREVSSQICWIVGSDGGYRRLPIRFPGGGLYMGVAERYEVVCDFSGHRGQSLYLWNGRDDRFKEVPYFCWSHLMMRIDVGTTVTSGAGARLDVATPYSTLLDRVLPDAVVAQQAVRARNNGYDREFHFGRNGGNWAINNKIWNESIIAARDVGDNTYELWRIRGGGGWFHPVHIHVVDFYIVHREDNGVEGLQPYEAQTPKDMLNIYSSKAAYILVRFGPHKGDYMYHCHNVRHEDHQMIRAIRLVDPNAGLRSATQIPGSQLVLNTATGIIYDRYLYREPELQKEANKDPSFITGPARTAQLPQLAAPYLGQRQADRLYRIFYPLQGVDPPILFNPTNNPWQFACRR